MSEQARVVSPSDILTPIEVAKRLKVTKAWVYEKMRSTCANPLPCYRVGRYLRFNWVDVSAWLESVKRGGRRASR
jgi:excisionase family DNA binding protein